MTPEAGSPQGNVAEFKSQKAGRELCHRCVSKSGRLLRGRVQEFWGSQGETATSSLSLCPSRAATAPGKDLGYTLVTGLGVVGADECLGGGGGILTHLRGQREQPEVLH